MCGHAQHVLTKTLNKMNAAMEVSDQQAAGVLLGLKTEITSDIFRYFNPYHAGGVQCT